MKLRNFTLALVLLVVLTFFKVNAIEQTSSGSEVLTNENIVGLIESGMSESLIFSIIKNTSTEFRLNPEALLELKGNGVSDSVIQVMLEENNKTEVQKPELHKYPVGISALVNGDFVPLTPISTEIKGGFGGLGLASFTGKVKQSRKAKGKTSDTILNTASPQLFAYLPGRDITKLNIVRLKVKGKNRIVGTMKSSFWSGSTRTKADKIGISLEEVQPNVFKFVLPGELEPGEYAVVDQDTIARPGIAEVWDFTITPITQTSANS